MNILIVGCGKTGSALAGILSREGHDVSIVDRHENSFSLLPEDYSGYITVGVPIDQDVLRKAGIENCDALAALSNDDNMNIMVCQLAQEIFHVDRVICRIHDPAREEVFSHFGLKTICPTNITIDSFKSALLSQPIQTIHLGCNAVHFRSIAVPKHLIGIRISEIEERENEAVFGVLHGDGTLSMVLTQDILLTETDRLIVAKLVD